MLEALGVRDSGIEADDSPSQGQGSAARAQHPLRLPSLSELLSGRGAAQAERIQRILRGINHLVKAQDLAALGTDVTALKNFASQDVKEGDRARYRGIIANCELLRPELRLGKQAGQFYDAVLRLAFGLPLSYQGYCQFEDILWTGGPPAAPPPRPLLAAIEQGGLTDAVVAILVLSCLGGQGLSAWFQWGQVDSAELIAKVAGLPLRPVHVPSVYGAIQDYLHVLQGRHGTETVVATLREHGYLAPALQGQLPDDPGYQASVLARLLRDCHGDRLKRDTATGILQHSGGTPTPALLKAVMGMLASPADHAAACRAFALGTLKSFGPPGAS
jgi:hypothetical protein